jgi:hypothetical protein
MAKILDFHFEPAVVGKEEVFLLLVVLNDWYSQDDVGGKLAALVGCDSWGGVVEFLAARGGEWEGDKEGDPGGLGIISARIVKTVAHIWNILKKYW